MKNVIDSEKSQQLKLVIEGKRYKWSDRFITGEQLKKLANIPMDKELYLSFQDPWDDELVQNQDQIDLARPGMEHFYVKHPLKFKINNEFFRWKSQYISGEQIRELGGIDDEHYLFLDFRDPNEDQLIEDDDRINLARPGVECFYSKPTKVKVTLIVKGREKEWCKRKISFEEVIILAYGSISDNPNICYTVAYKRGPRQNPDGSMVEGQVVFVKNKMVFNVSFVDKS